MSNATDYADSIASQIQADTDAHPDAGGRPGERR